MEQDVNNSNFRGCRTSALELVKRCPFAVQKIYRDKLKGRIDYTALRGSAVHDALEDYGKHCLKHKTATDFEYYDSIVYKYAASVPQEVHQETFDILLDSKEFVNFGLHVEAKEAVIERRFYLDENLDIIEPCDNSFFSSAIDTYFIDHDNVTAHVFDYKTSRKIFSKSVLASKLQKDYYPFLIFQAHPEIETVYFYFDFIRYGHTMDPVIVTRTDHYDHLRARLLSDITRYYEVVNTKKDLEARPSGFCTLCEVDGICPAKKNALNEDILITDETSACAAARQLKALQQRLKDVKLGLGNYLNHKQNIPISETEGYGITVGTKDSVQDLFHLVDELKNQGVAPGTIFDSLKLSKAAFLKLIKKTSIQQSKYLLSKVATKTEFYDLEQDDEEEEEEYG